MSLSGAVGARRPSWPQPVMRPYTSPGLTSARVVGPENRDVPSLRRKPSMSTSALAMSEHRLAVGGGF